MTEADYGIVWSASRARASADQLAEWQGFAQALCDAADSISLQHFRRELDIQAKPDRTFVTVADQSIERLIRERIRSRYPGHGLVGEEYGEEAGEGRVGRARRQRLPHLGRDRPQQLAFLVRQPHLEVPLARAPDALTPLHQSCCMVAHRPCSWRRKTSSSAFSRGPLDTTALPLWWTSSMSLVAFSRL